jgi:hypothetical protein
MTENKEKFEESEWEITNRRFITVLDIMGFKDYIARTKHESVYNTMKKLSDFKHSSDEMVGCLYDKSFIFITSFSDSIFIFSKDNSKDSLEAISYETSFILAKAAKDRIPMKGAMAEGLLTVDKSEQIYFGQALIDAHLLQENEVNYYGVVCHNSVEIFIEKYQTQLKSDPITSHFKEILTPLKSGNINHTNLIWFNYINLGHDIEVPFREVIKGFKTMTSGNPRKYIDNTEAVFRLVYPQQ